MNQVIQNVKSLLYKLLIILVVLVAGSIWYTNASEENAGTMMQYFVAKLFKIELQT